MQRAPSYGSDLVVDLLRVVGIEYVVLKPGATYGARHDSLVNYGGNRARHDRIRAAVREYRL